MSAASSVSDPAPSPGVTPSQSVFGLGSRSLTVPEVAQPGATKPIRAKDRNGSRRDAINPVPLYGRSGWQSAEALNHRECRRATRECGQATYEIHTPVHLEDR